MSTPPHPQRARAIVMLVLVTLFWGLSFPVLKTIGLLHREVLPASNTWFVAAWSVAPRFLLAAAVLALVRWRILGGLTRNELRQGGGLAFFAGIGLLLQVDGLQYTSASTSAFLTQVYAVLLPLWAAWRLRRWPSGMIWLAAALVLVGVAILARFDPREFRLGRGEAETLLGALFFMGQILWLERPDFAGNRVSRVTLVMFGALGIAFALLSTALAPHPGDVLVLWGNGPWLGLTLLLTAVCTLFCFTMMNAWQPRITATEAGLIYCLEPVSASVMALVLPAIFSAWAGVAYANEALTWHLLAGGAFVTAANVLVVLRPPGR